MPKPMLVIYRVGDRVPDEIARPIYNQSGADGIITTQHLFDAVDIPEAGDRTGVREFQTNDLGELTHSRLGPWEVEAVEIYHAGALGGSAHGFTDIVFCTCAYVPFPETENPWVSVKWLGVSEAIAA